MLTQRWTQGRTRWTEVFANRVCRDLLLIVPLQRRKTWTQFRHPPRSVFVTEPPSPCPGFAGRARWRPHNQVTAEGFSRAMPTKSSTLLKQLDRAREGAMEALGLNALSRRRGAKPAILVELVPQPHTSSS